MKFKILLSLFLLGSALSSFAQGYKDGVEYCKVNEFEKAKILLDRNMDKPETNKAEAYYYLGEIAIANDNTTDAKANFDKGIQANAEYGYNYVGLGALALKAGNRNSAEDYFKTAKSKDKKDPALCVAVAKAYSQVNSVTYAKDIDKNIAQAKKIDKTNPAAYLFEGDMLAKDKKWGDAAGYYEMAQMFDNNCTEAYVKYANTYFFVNPEAAIEKIKSLLAANPNSALAQSEYAEKLYENDQWTKAAQAYGDYIKNPNHFKEDEERYSVLLYFGGNNQESYDLAKKILASNPNSFLMKRMVFLNKAAMKDYAAANDAAKDFFGSSDPKNKYSSNDYVVYSEVLKELGKSDESLAMIEKAVEINPEKVDLLKDLSSAYGASKNYEKSAEYYQKFIDAGTYTTNDLFVLAGKYQNVLATATDPVKKKAALDSALKYIDIVIDRVPDDYRIPQRKARILMLTDVSKKDGKAVASYNKVLELLNANPENLTKNADAYKEAYNYLGGYELESGNKEQAKVYYQKYLNLDPQNAELRKYVESLK